MLSQCTKTTTYPLRVGCFISFLTIIALLSSNNALATDFVSVKTTSAILYDGPTLQAKKKFVVNRYMPLEQILVTGDWVKVRDSKGELSWVEKRVLDRKRYVFILPVVADIYAEPRTDAALVFQAKQQVALEHLQSTGTGWVKVRHLDGETGFIRSNDLWGD